MPLPIIKYPYLPEGREYLYVPQDNEFMQAAKKVASGHGCRKHATGAVAVKNGQILVTGNNAGTYVTVCPRVYNNFGTGQGYRYCQEYCEQVGHSEATICLTAQKKGVNLNGADIYLYGHWWACKNCWDHMIEAGIRNLYLMEKSETLFNDTIQLENELQNAPQLTLYVSGPLTGIEDPNIKLMYEEIGILAESMGIKAIIPHLQTDPIKHKNVTSEDVYKTDSNAVKQADLMICYVGIPSLGAGMEIEMANRYKTLTILISEQYRLVSRFAKGSPCILEHLLFKDKPDLFSQLKKSLEKFLQTSRKQNISLK